jgi:alanine racemase
MVRPGIALYGYHPGSEITNRLDLQMSLKLKTFLETVKPVDAGNFIGYGCSYKAERDMLVGVAGIGYGDGYDRGLSNKGVMTISDIPIPVIGKVTMNQTILDLTDLPSQGVTPYPGMEVTVIDNSRDSDNNIERIAVALGTVPHEIAARLGRSIKRVGVRRQR